MRRNVLIHWPWRHVYGVVQLLAGVASAVALLAYPWIPPRVVSLVPRTHTTHLIYGYQQPSGEPTSAWIDEAAEHWRCEFVFADGYSCGYMVGWGSDRTQGVDLSEYEYLGVKIQYSGPPSARVRFFMRNYNPIYANPDKIDSYKFLAVSANADDLDDYLQIDLNRFAVGEWWLQAYNIPLAQAGVEIDNVVVIGIDFQREGVHEVKVERLELIGPRISKEAYYLTILLFWLVLILSEGALRVMRLLRKSRRAAQRIEALVTSYKTLEHEKQRFETLSATDPLTGVLNRNGFDRFVESLGSDSQTGVSGGLLVIDVDHFKRINDNHGHDVGDQVLRELALTLQNNIRAQDVLARWGGEEFILLCPRLNKDSVMRLCEKLRVIIANAQFEADAKLRVTLSIGATVLRPGQDFSDAFKLADQALYQAKSSGRNRVVLNEV